MPRWLLLLLGSALLGLSACESFSPAASQPPHLVESDAPAPIPTADDGGAPPPPDPAAVDWADAPDPLNLPTAAESPRLDFDPEAVAESSPDLVAESWADPDETTPARPAGALEVRSEGSRILVRLAEQFELTFASGACVTWKDAHGRNLGGDFGLGPWHLPLADGWLDHSNAPLAEQVRWDRPNRRMLEVDQVLREESPVRVVIHGVARWTAGAGRAAGAAAALGDDTLAELSAAARPPVDRRSAVRPPDSGAPAPVELTLRPPGAGGFATEEESRAVAASLELSEAAEGQPLHEWQYTIYPTGEVYVYTRVSGRGLRAAAAVLTVSRGIEARRLDGPAGAPGAALFRLIAGTTKQTVLYWLVQGAPEPLHERLLSEDSQAALIAGSADGGRLASAAHLLLMAERAEAATLPVQVEAARAPPRVRLVSGVRVTTEAGDLNHDGFNEGEGVYEFAPDGGRLSVEFEAGATPLPALRLRIHESGQGRPYVYIDGRPVAITARDAADRPLLALPPLPAAQRRLVEVHTSRRN